MPRSDPFLPVSPAQVKALVLPVGPVHQQRFVSFLERLRSEDVVHLRDISADSRPHRNMFSPLAFPDGAIFYDLITHVPQPSHLALVPFDHYREPLVVLAVADGTLLRTVDFANAANGSTAGTGPGRKRLSALSANARSIEERNIRMLDQELEELRDTYTRVLVHRVLIFDYEPTSTPASPGHGPIPIPEGMATVPPLAQSKRTTMRTVMCDVSSLLLAEMTTLARSFEAMSYIESPSGAGGDDASSLPSRRNSQFAVPKHGSSSSISSAGVVRSSSVGSMTLAERAQARMSMPVPFKGAYGGSDGGVGSGSASGSGSGNSTPRRPSTPVRSGLSGPATTFDEMGSTGTASPERMGSPSQADMAGAGIGAAAAAAATADRRVSVQGFGSGGLNERWRNKGKSRVTIVVASLYLQAGRWTDALKELIEGATVARSINDHLWHGKALELIVVCLLLLAWADLEFQVPSVCLPPPEKGAAAHAAAQALEAAEKAHPEQPRWLRHLQQLLPDLLERILALYARISAEHLPPLPMAEVTIRFSNLLTALHAADGLFGRVFLDMAVDGRYDAARMSRLSTSPRLSVTPSRSSLLAMVMRVLPPPSSFASPSHPSFPPSQSSPTPDTLTTVDRILLLSGIAAVLGRLGYRRKKALIARELLSALTDGLVEARTRGAAEMGIHPAAGLMVPASSAAAAAAAVISSSGSDGPDDAESDVDAFLDVLLRTYGVVGTQQRYLSTTDSTVGTDDSDDAVIARIRAQTAARLFGQPSLKMQVLWACINFCEALPDFGGVLRFSSDLLRTAGSGVAPGSRQEDSSAMIMRDEQVRLATNIAKTVALVRQLGLDSVAGRPLVAEYWDEFLVRSVKLELPPAACVPIAHKKSEITGGNVGHSIIGSISGSSGSISGAGATAGRTSQDVDPFIHNPFLKAADKAVVAQTLVAMEPATFRVTLQNTYDVEVVIESIQLETTGVEFEAYVESVVLGPYRTQTVRVMGMPKAAGQLTVTGAVVRIHGCRERRFPIFARSWVPERDEKVKRIGQRQRGGNADTSRLRAEHVTFEVIPPQPMVVVQSTTLPQSSAMMLEGERQVFAVTLKNLSASTPVDFLVFSFQDSTQATVQAALASRDATPAELYEYELILAKKQALRLRKTHRGGEKNAIAKTKTKTRRYIGPGETMTYEFEILGKPGLTSGTIQVDYAHLGMKATEVVSSFHTRQVSLHLTVTVNASIEVARVEVLPLQGRIPKRLWSRCQRANGKITEGNEDENEDTDKGEDGPEDYCLLLLDLRNAWPSQMRVDLMASGDDVVGGVDETRDRGVSYGDVHVTEHILPGNTSRVLVPLRRIYLEDPHAAIPALNPSRQRQFVVSSSRITPEMERTNREAFWYRERILDILRGTWSTADGRRQRSGTLELRNMRLTSRMIEAVKVDEVGIEMWWEGGEAGAEDDSAKRATAKISTLEVDGFAQLVVRVTNRTAEPIYPLLRMMPALCHRPLNVALDFTRKFAWNGTLQQTLPLLPPRSSTEVRLGATPLCRGEFEVTASIEETRLWVEPEEEAEDGERKDGKDSKDSKDKDGSRRNSKRTTVPGRPRSNTETLMMASMLGAKERRIWHSRSPCHFVVTDGKD